MARQRARNYDDSNVRLGRGGSFPDGSGVEHIGAKDPLQKRSRQFNVRLTEAEAKAIRDAHAALGGDGSLTEFVAGVLVDGLESRRDGITLIGDGSAAALAEVAALRRQVETGLADSAESASGLMALVAQTVKLQEGLGRVGVANARQAQSLVDAVATLASAVDGMSDRLERALARLGAELTPTDGSRAEAAGGRRVD